MFELARAYKQTGMAAYSRLQQKEFSSEHDHGYEAVKHQRFVGTGYFDTVTQVIAGGTSSVTALAGSTEAEQFAPMKPQARPKSAPDAACQSMLSDCPSPGAIVQLQATEPGPEELLLPSGD
jgi:hypothetical protein